MIHPTKKICASAGSLGFVIVVWSVRSFPTLRNFWPKNGHCVLPLLLLLLLLLFWCERVSYLERASGVVAEGLWYFSTLVIALIFFCVMGHVDRRRQAQGIICCCVLTCKLRRTTPYVLVLFFFFHPIYYLRPSILSLLVATQIRGHIAGSSPPLPTTVRTLRLFSREDFSSFFPRRLASNCAYPGLGALSPYYINTMVLVHTTTLWYVVPGT